MDVDHIGQGHGLASSNGNGAVIGDQSVIFGSNLEGGDVGASDGLEILIGVGTSRASPSAGVGLFNTVHVGLQDVVDGSLLSRSQLNGDGVGLGETSLVSDLNRNGTTDSEALLTVDFAEEAANFRVAEVTPAAPVKV